MLGYCRRSWGLKWSSATMHILSKSANYQHQTWVAKGSPWGWKTQRCRPKDKDGGVLRVSPGSGPPGPHCHGVFLSMRSRLESHLASVHAALREDAGGYASHFIGKGHLGWQTTDHLLVNRGFDSHVGCLGGS